MKAAAIFICLCVLLPIPGVAEQSRDPDRYFFNDSFFDFIDELEMAKASGKQGILLMFGQENCPFCERMRQTVLNQQRVQSYFREHFRVIYMDIDVEVEMIDFQGNETTVRTFSQEIMRVRVTPVFAFFDLEGKLMKNTRLTGAARNTEEFLLLGRFVAEGIHKQTNFQRFKRAIRKKTKGA